MRTWLKWTGIAAAGLMATTAMAADHTDGPATSGNDAGDINDVYAWRHADGDKLVMIQTIGGVTAAALSPSVQYVFHVGRQETEPFLAVPADWTNVICEFETAASAQCWVDAGDATGAADYVTGDPSGNAGIVGVNGNITVHAAQHADPFFFYLSGLNNARDYIRFLVGNGATPNAEGCFDLSGNTTNTGCAGATVAAVVRGLLDGTYENSDCLANTAIPANTFENINASAIVIELDKSVIAGAGEYFAVYASTHTKN